MKKFTIIAALIIAVAFVSSAMAVPPGETVEFKGGAMGKVTFDGKTHADNGLKCDDCHEGNIPFTVKKGTAKITMDDHNVGKLCFSCHNGIGAFATD
ncbi:MAG: cytochrome c3 family protein, partial [Thermodesulfovibrionales bacterium]|nr:cytochrome c3 family protein [Thermodesulfovibrionales bacterium]